MNAQTPLDPVVLAFVAIPLLLAAALAFGAGAAWRRAGASIAAARRVTLLVGLASAAWMAVTWAAAASGVLRDWDRMPPPLALLVVGIITLALAIAFSPLGRRLSEHLPLWVLVGVQGFRLPLEIAMHAMSERGVMPEVMSYSGRNLDIVTGATALAVAVCLVVGVGGRALVAAWNVMGLVLLANIVGVAILATPSFAYFGEDNLNVWVTYPPFVWLPAVMVLAALAGHLVIFRALRGDR